jgi:phosphoenolpyruvate---glycerone phosphotransferase subunit DhaL
VTGEALRTLLVGALPRLAASRDELRDLDAAIGDGDLGVTVGDGALAAAAALEALDPDPSPALVLRTVGMTVARANPSTFSALAMGALLAAAKELGDAAEVDAESALRAAQAAADSIAIRGKSAVGDKTVLDALVPSLDAAAAAPDAALLAAIEAARDGVEGTRALVSQRGRAAWVGERTAGHADGGATAYVRLLEAIATELGQESGTSEAAPA